MTGMDNAPPVEEMEVGSDEQVAPGMDIQEAEDALDDTDAMATPLDPEAIMEMPLETDEEHSQGCETEGVWRNQYPIHHLRRYYDVATKAGRAQLPGCRG